VLKILYPQQLRLAPHNHTFISKLLEGFTNSFQQKARLFRFSFTWKCTQIKRIPGKLTELRQPDMLMYYPHVKLNSISHSERTQLCFKTQHALGNQTVEEQLHSCIRSWRTVFDICIMKHLNCSAMVSWRNKNEFWSLNTFWLLVLQKQHSLMRNIKRFSCTSLPWFVPNTVPDFLQSLNNRDVLD
jgi:hypothetical protein